MVAAVSGCSASVPPSAPDEPPPTVASASGAAAAQESAIASRAHTWGEKLQIYLLRCMRDAGWEVHLEPDFSLTGQVPIDQRSANMRDNEACQAAYEAAHPKPVLTAADYRARYADELKTMKCLEHEGYPPVESPISEQRFVSEMLHGSVSWTAYGAVGAVGGAEWDRLQTVCPQPGDM